MDYNEDSMFMSIYYDGDLLLAGDTYTDYAVVIKCSKTNGKIIQTAFTLRIHNPCKDPAKVEFPTKVEMPESVTYILDDSELPIASKSLLSIKTTPNGSDVCQSNISYIVTWDGIDVTQADTPVRIVSLSAESLQLALQTGDPQ